MSVERGNLWICDGLPDGEECDSDSSESRVFVRGYGLPPGWKFHLPKGVSGKISHTCVSCTEKWARRLVAEGIKPQPS